MTGSIFIIVAVVSILIAENLKSEVQRDDEKNSDDDVMSVSEEYPIAQYDDSFKSLYDDCAEPSFPNLTKPPKLDADIKCPNGFSLFEDVLGTPFCYMLTEKQRFPPKCPYINYREDFYKKIYRLFKNESIWIKAERNLDNQFGEFEWFAFSPYYSSTLKYYLRPNTTVADKNCMITLNCTLFAVSCKEEHRVLCIYSYDSESMTNYCSRRSNFNCISTSFAMDNRCYCQATTTGLSLARNAFCRNFAEPDLFQTRLIEKFLTNKSPCWIGIEQINGTLQWSSSKRIPEYTEWKSNVNFSKLYGALDYDHPPGWILTDDNSLECAICYREVPYRNVTIHLKQTYKNLIEIEISNVLDMHYYSKFEYAFVCFTDYETSNMKKRIKANIFDTKIRDASYITTMEVYHHYPAYYWCESVQRPNLTRVFSNKILAYNNDGSHNHEYSVLVKIPISPSVDPYINEVHVDIAHLMKYKLASLGFVNVVRPMRITHFFEETHNLNLLLHISTIKNYLSGHEEYDTLLHMLKEIPKELPSAVQEILSFLRCEVCLESTTVSRNGTLTWPESAAGVTALPNELCLRADSLPVTRTCEGDFTFGARWANVTGECVNENVSNTTLTLHSMLSSKIYQPNKVIANLVNITNRAKQIKIVDVHFVSELIQKLSRHSEIDSKRVVDIVSNIMSFERGVMNQAQEQLNSTDIALNALDTILEDAILEEEEHIIKSNKIIVHISDLSVSNIQGVALYKLSNASVNNFSDYYTITPYNSSIDDLGEVEAAVLLPTDEILRCQHAHKYESVTVIISFFYNDALFNDPSKGKEISTTIVAGVVIPSLKCQLMNPFILIFKSDLNITSPRCAHWNYGLKNQHKNIRGNWKVDSMPTVKSGKPTYVVCRANHLTHFSVLVATRNFQVQQTPQVHLALNIITSIGCALSLTGLSGIFLIGIFYKSWRKRKRNIIMLNFSAALAAEMILFFVSDLVRDNATACRIVGASLHYTIIASFGWMLIVAILQYRRFVLVYEQTIRCLILKSLIIGWCMPLILVLVCITTFPDSYNKNGDGMCYPDGIYLYYTVAVPILIFVLINLFVIIKILHNVCNIKVERYGADRNEIRLQVSFAILLFFLLGMSWIFGLGVTVSSNTVLSFIFCITATLQGFVVFICFVLMNKESRVFWVNIKKFIICAKMRSQS